MKYNSIHFIVGLPISRPHVFMMRVRGIAEHGLCQKERLVEKMRSILYKIFFNTLQKL